MKRRIWPILHLRDVTVFDRIEAHIIEVAREIARVTYRVLPMASLPDTTLALRMRLGEILFPLRSPRENIVLIRRLRSAKSASPSGSVQTA